MTAVLLLIAACVVALAFILRAVRRELRNAGMPHPGMPQREPWPRECGASGPRHCELLPGHPGPHAETDCGVIYTWSAE